MLFDNFRKVGPNSMAARVFLSFLATAGMFYVNILPALVDGLITALGFTNQQAGAVASANIYGAAAGAFLIVFLVKHLNWQWTALALLLGLIACDVASIYVDQPDTMVDLRSLDGFIGGTLVGLSYAVFSRTEHPDKTFGVLLFVQFGLGGLGVMVLPYLVGLFGTKALFLALIAFTTTALIMLPFLPAYPVNAEDAAAKKALHGKIKALPLVLTLIAIFLFQASNNALYAYIIGLGNFFGQEGAIVNTTLGVAAWLGLVGAGLVVLFSDKYGYQKVLWAGMAVTIIGNAALLYSGNDLMWILANCLVGITWAFTIAYLLGLVSRFDTAGQMAALGGFASKMGLASGPALAAMFLGEDNYVTIIWAAVFGLILCLMFVLFPARVQDRSLRNN
jgi:predicted MFS family arabinose efflux permease